MNDDQNSPWQYKPDKGAPAAAPSVPDDRSSPQSKAATIKSIEWEGPEFIEHPHGFSWYMALAACTAVLTALVYLIAHDIIAAIIIVVVGFIVGVFASQKPGQAKYEINDQGLTINGKTYNYGDYKSFAVIDEGSLSSINLFPLKRLLPPLSAYFDHKDRKKITDAIGNYLPYDERKLDTMERLTRRLRL
jgi:hypothetical protein